MTQESRTRNRSVTLTSKTEDRIEWLMADMDMPSFSQLVRTAVDRLYEERSHLRLKNPLIRQNTSEPSENNTGDYPLG